MNADKLSGTLYDLIGYVLPGYVVLVALSVAESTFCRSSLIPLSGLERNVGASTIAAYYLGHAAFALSAVLRGSRFTRRWTKSKKHRLGGILSVRVQEVIAGVYGLPLESVQAMTSLEAFLLADSYVVAFGGSADRDIYMAREGFFKASMVAFALSAISFLTALFRGGAGIRVDRDLYHLSSAGTLSMAIAFLAMAAICRTRYLFFNGVKITHTETVFLSLALKVKGKV
jgi:hypothetical protein